MEADKVTLIDDGWQRLDSLERASSAEQDVFFHRTLLLNQRFYKEQLGRGLDRLAGYKKNGLAIVRWGVYDESEYTDGTGIQITFYNPTDEVIKYISISFQGYNAVDDPYGRLITNRCIGPIYPRETGTYQFEYAWLTDIVEYAKIRSITVSYKNGKTKTISTPSGIVMPEEVVECIFTSNPVEKYD